MSGQGDRLRRRVAKVANDPEQARAVLDRRPASGTASPFAGPEEGVDFVCEVGHLPFTAGRFRRLIDGEWVCRPGDSGRMAFDYSAPDGHMKIRVSCNAICPNDNKPCGQNAERQWENLRAVMEKLLVASPRAVVALNLAVLHTKRS